MTEETHDVPTKEELLEEAREKDIPGRSQMSKDELVEVLGKTEHDHVAELAEWRKKNYQDGVVDD
jgi:acylphosphatase